MRREEASKVFEKLSKLGVNFMGTLLNGDVSEGKPEYDEPGGLKIEKVNIYNTERHFHVLDESGEFGNVTWFNREAEIEGEFNWIEERLNEGLDVAVFLGRYELDKNDEAVKRYNLPLESYFDAVFSKIGDNFYINYVLEDDNSQILVTPLHISNYLENMVELRTE